ncbi:rCG25241, isoform CRA_b [Rattus norvegicus]|uniref:RCG25241, isoform CRA_b n=1 Tax=Rattus norvegicus TaxID=10116 RepID=A6I3R7_RAT|nr:rCG25241, isoform CRA_b [Rattus norvegicus]
MTPGKKIPVFVDGVVLNGPQTDVKAGEKFVEEACRLIMEEVVLKATDINEKVCEWQPPEQLRQLLDLEMRDTGESQDKLLKLCQDVIRYSVKTNHPRFFNQLYAGLDYHSLAARIITEALNPSIYTYEVSPVFLLVEEAVLKKMIECVGWKEGDGIFNPGGSVSNMCAMNLARYRHCPDIKDKGLSGLPRLILFTSAECHYSMKKAASFLGIGTQNVYFVETDGRGKMIPEELEKQIWQGKQEGAVPFLVCATSGTTVLGAFDPLDEIAEVCERHGLWLHVDASWGGSALVSRKHRRLLHGIHRADSVAWNPHKMLMAGIQCSALLVKDKSPEYTNVCFWYIPPSLREMAEGPEFWRKLSLVAPAIKEKMMKKGSLMLGYQPHRGKVNFFRQVVISPQVSREDMDFLLDEIDSLGRDM